MTAARPAAMITTSTMASTPTDRSRASPNAAAKTATTAANTTVPTRRSMSSPTVVSPIPISAGTSGDEQGEGDDLRRRVAAGDEELSVVAEQVEHRLRHRQTAQPADDQPPSPDDVDELSSAPTVEPLPYTVRLPNRHS